MSRTRFASKNYLSGILYTAVTLLTGLIATPLLLRWLGAERFGAYRVTLDWYGYLAFFELGLGGALLPLLARTLGKNEQEKVRDLLAASVRAYFGIVAAMLLAGLMLGIFITRFISVSAQSIADLRAGYFIGLVSLLWLPLASPFRALFDARQRSYWITLLLTLQSLLITGLSLVFAWKNWGITGQFVAFMSGVSLLSAVLIWKGLRQYPRVLIRAFRADYDRSAARELWKLNTPTYIVNLCGRVSLLTDNIVVAAILGPVMVVPLILTQRLAALAQGQLQGIGNASWAGLAELYSRGEKEKFQSRILELTSVTSVLAIAALLPIAVFNRPFVSLWVGPNRYGGQWMTLFAAVNAFLLSLFSLWGWVFSGTGEVRRVVRPLIFQTLFNFIASVLLTHLLGAVGPLIGTFIGFVAVTAWSFPVQLHRVFEISVSKLLYTVMRPVLLGLPYGIGLWLFERGHMALSWFELGAEMLFGSAFYLLMAWLLVLTPSDRELWRFRMKLLLGVSAGRAKVKAAANVGESNLETIIGSE